MLTCLCHSRHTHAVSGSVFATHTHQASSTRMARSTLWLCLLVCVCVFVLLPVRNDEMPIRLLMRRQFDNIPSQYLQYSMDIPFRNKIPFSSSIPSLSTFNVRMFTHHSLFVHCLISVDRFIPKLKSFHFNFVDVWRRYLFV